MTAPNKRLIVILTTASLLLLLPLIAMQFTREVAWSPFDFLIAAVLLFGTGLSLELALRKLRTRQQRLIACAAILLLLALVWAELAVGVFGTPLAGS